MSTGKPALLNDKDISHLVRFSPSWVRVQRHFRRHGKPHVLTIDPIQVGSKPRYRAEDVSAWLEEIKGTKKAVEPGNAK